MFRTSGTEDIAKVNLLLSALSQDRLGLFSLSIVGEEDSEWRSSKESELERLVLQDFLTLRMRRYEVLVRSPVTSDWLSGFRSISHWLDTALHNEDLQRRWFTALSKDSFFRQQLLDLLRQRAKYGQKIIAWIEG